ncbi:unnamed protein product [Sphagnum balticum]
MLTGSGGWRIFSGRNAGSSKTIGRCLYSTYLGYGGTDSTVAPVYIVGWYGGYGVLPRLHSYKSGMQRDDEPPYPPYYPAMYTGVTVLPVPPYSGATVPPVHRTPGATARAVSPVLRWTGERCTSTQDIHPFLHF